MKITLHYDVSIEENASNYYNKAKKARQKIDRVNETIASFEKKASKQKTDIEFESSFKKISHEKQYWYEKFKWFYTSEGFLVIAGRDATSNEIIIKKHTEEGDVVFHTDMAGSPFVVIKKKPQDQVPTTPTNTIGDVSIQEAANFTAIHSKTWKMGLSTTDVFYVDPSQVTKETNSGESIGRGSFMIRGKTTYVPVNLDYAVGIFQPQENESILIAGPISAVKHHCKYYIRVEQGKEKTSQVAKQVRARLRKKSELDADLDEIVRHLPSGGCYVSKER